MSFSLSKNKKQFQIDSVGNPRDFKEVYRNRRFTAGGWNDQDNVKLNKASKIDILPPQKSNYQLVLQDWSKANLKWEVAFCVPKHIFEAGFNNPFFLHQVLKMFSSFCFEI